MGPQVDAGSLIAVRRFPVFPWDDVASLLSRAYDYQLVLFYDITGLIAAGEPLPSAGEGWKREPITRKELDGLSEIGKDMDGNEIARRIRATSFGPFKPVVHLHGYDFELKT